MPLKSPILENPEEVRETLLPLRNRVSVAVYACHNPFAVGAIIRVAHSFLVREIIIVGDAPYYEKASMGMEKYESIVRVQDGDDFFAHANGRPIWAVERERATRSLYDARPFPEDVIFVFGSERFGLPEHVLDRASQTLGIPMYGVNNSFPVAIAAGMVMGEWARRKYARGE